LVDSEDATIVEAMWACLKGTRPGTDAAGIRELANRVELATGQWRDDIRVRDRTVAVFISGLRWQFRYEGDLDELSLEQAAKFLSKHTRAKKVPKGKLATSGIVADIMIEFELFDTASYADHQDVLSRVNRALSTKR
jgi:hypothetical protein